MTIGKVCLTTPAVRAVLLKALAATGNMTRAAKVAGVTRNAVNHQRRADKRFDAQIRAATATANGAAWRVHSYRAWDAATCAAFLVSLAGHGSVARAATEVGGSQSGAYDVRNRDADFAYGWAKAKLQAHGLIEDALFEGAVAGYVETRTAADGATTTIHRQRPDIMLKLVARGDAGRTRYRTIELSPHMLESSRRKLERRTRVGIEMGLAAHMSEAEAKARAADIDMEPDFPTLAELAKLPRTGWEDAPEPVPRADALAPIAATP
ncbi:hypothetical protein KX816_14455 [Sphingosinicellaceae bacterium]|nr:hypothetical protein KX816_14455 [Sphingosinicellaceae bacterium]